MSRENIFRTIVLFALVLFGTGGILYIRSTVFNLRPVQLTILDRETEEPIEGVPVYHVLRSYVVVNTILFFLPRPDPTDKKKYEITDKYYSDEFGKVTIKQKEVRLWQIVRERRIYKEEIFINLDLRYEVIKGQDKFRCMSSDAAFLRKSDFVNPIKEYKGFYIYSTTWKIPKEYVPTWSHVAGVKKNSEGLLKSEEEFTIKLSRWRLGGHPIIDQSSGRCNK